MRMVGRSDYSREMTSVVIPTYRGAQWIGRAIRSLQAERELIEKIVVVEDGVFDNTQEVLKGFPEIELITHERNFGAVAARNSGLGAVSSEYVVFLDADDYIEGGLLSGLLESIESDSADVAFGRSLEEFPGGLRRNERKISNSDPSAIIKGWLNGEFVAPCSVMWRSASLRRIGAWNSSITYNDDGELVLRALIRGLRPALSSKGTGIYTQHEGPWRVSKSDGTEVVKTLSLVGSMVEEWLATTRSERGAIALALGSFYYGAARRAYQSGLYDEGDVLLARSRRYGLRGHRGLLRHRLVASVLGLKGKEKLCRNWTVKSVYGALKRAKRKIYRQRGV